MIWGRKKVKDALTEKRALPTGRKEFHEWSDRIIQGAMLTATPDSQKFALANTLMNLAPTVSFETDLYFIQVLRKHAVNQVADTMRSEIREATKARLASEEAKQNQGDDTPPVGTDAKVLGDGGVSQT